MPDPFDVRKAMMRPAGHMTDGLRELIARLPQNCVMVEIGVLRGEATALFLSKASKIYCVDQWRDYKDCDDGKVVNVAEMESLFDELAYRNHEKIVKMKGTSTCMAMLIPDKSLDFAYIDACHEYKHVKVDIRTWLPKVKCGGVIGGHDYAKDNDVCRAVSEVLGKVNVFKDTSWIYPVGG